MRAAREKEDAGTRRGGDAEKKKTKTMVKSDC